MANKKVYTVPFRRKRQGKTDYKKRLAALKSGKPRLVVRKFNRHILAQLVEFGPKGDKVICQAYSSELKKLGWTHSTSNIPAAYLVGLLAAKKAKGKQAIVDIGLQTPIKGSKLFAVVKGAIDGGLKISASAEVFPSEERLKGAHMKDQPKEFEKVKKSILG